ncbi:MAG: hypothetical protein MJ133_01880 [Lachnospiraceae bacterium]|nr:hypothetical protein [Lachnospiraceae bacterium]
MIEKNGLLRTRIITNEDETHVYEICREFDRDEGDEIILFSLFPTMTEPGFDLSSMHLINHSAELNLKTVHFLFLQSKVSKAKLSTRGLKVDKENLDYIRSAIEMYPEAKIVVSFGSSMNKCPAVIESKVEIFKIIKELRPNDPIFQIDTDDVEETGAHILWLGIRYGSQEWRLTQYVVPYCYTPEGFEAYEKEKMVRRELFIQNVLGKKSELTEGSEKTTKGKKKSGNKES